MTTALESPPSKAAVVEESLIGIAILRGIAKADAMHRMWSNGYWLSDAGIENIMQTYVAEACFEALGPRGLFVHPKGALKGFFGRDDEETRRADLMIADVDEKPVYIVELKRGGKWYGRDTQKIFDAMIGYRHRSKRRIKAAFWGAFVIWHSGQRKCKGIADAIEATKENLRSTLNEPRLRIQWDTRDLPAVDWTYDDGSTARWEGAALVATITRRD